MGPVWENPYLISGALFLSGFEEGLTVATVVESALCALRNCLAFMPPGNADVWYLKPCGRALA